MTTLLGSLIPSLLFVTAVPHSNVRFYVRAGCAAPPFIMTVAAEFMQEP
jgi:hypothetical protein